MPDRPLYQPGDELDPDLIVLPAAASCLLCGQMVGQHDDQVCAAATVRIQPLGLAGFGVTAHWDRPQ